MMNELEVDGNGWFIMNMLRNIFCVVTRFSVTKCHIVHLVKWSFYILISDNKMTFWWIHDVLFRIELKYLWSRSESPWDFGSTQAKGICRKKSIIHTHTYIYIYVYIYVYMYIYISMEQKWFGKSYMFWICMFNYYTIHECEKCSGIFPIYPHECYHL